MIDYSSKIMSEIENILNIGIALSAEREHDKILEMILSEARKITNADAGTLFLCKDNKLSFKIIHNEKLNIFKGVNGEEIDLPSVAITKDNVAGYVALTKKSVNISDVYNSDRFNFSGPKKYDQITGYETVSMLVIPLKDHQNKVLGVLQLINAKDKMGKIIPFATYFEKVISSLASQAAIILSNAKFLADIENLLHSFVKVVATTIDARTPYNANHTRRVAKMSQEIINYINRADATNLAGEFFDEKRSEQLIMAAWLHDIGKIATPLKVMNKATRLAEKLDIILQRFDYIAIKLEIDHLKRSLKAVNTKELKSDYLKKIEELERAKSLVIAANNPANFVDEAMLESLEEIASLNYIDREGQLQTWLSETELEALSVSKGTLTSQERKVMEYHVELGGEILSLIPFPDELEDIPNWVMQHHEYLDGTGYPKQLKGEEIALEGRILSLLDIFDALTAADRPYKKAMSVPKALAVLDKMADEGKLDNELFKLFKAGEIWECLAEKDYA